MSSRRVLGLELGAFRAMSIGKRLGRKGDGKLAISLKDCCHMISRLKDWQASKETAYYFCDIVLPAAQFNQIIRAHWGIENRLHHVRDTRLNEDASRIRRNPGIFALLRSFAL